MHLKSSGAGTQLTPTVQSRVPRYGERERERERGGTATDLFTLRAESAETTKTNARKEPSHYSPGNSGGAPTILALHAAPSPSVTRPPPSRGASFQSRGRRTNGRTDRQTERDKRENNVHRERKALLPPSLPSVASVATSAAND